MLTCVFDTEAKATDADADTVDEYSFNRKISTIKKRKYSIV